MYTTMFESLLISSLTIHVYQWAQAFGELKMRELYMYMYVYIGAFLI